MPKRPARRRFQRRRARRAIKRVPRNVVRVTQRSAFPDKARVKFMFTRTNLSLGDNTSPGFFQERTLNDPTNNNADIPLGWAQWSDVYDSYMVRGCMFKAVFTNTSTTIPVRAVMCPFDNDTILTGFPNILGDVFLRNNYAKSKYLSIAGGGRDIQIIKKFVPLKRLSGLGRLTLANETYQGYTGSGNSAHTFTQPTALWNWAFGAATTTGANLASNQVYVDIEMIFYVEFYEKLQVY